MLPVLPALLIPLEAALLALAAYILMQLAVAWLRPLLRGIVAIFPGGKIVKNAAGWYASLPKFAKIALYPIVPVVGVPVAVVKGLQLLEHRVVHALGSYAAAHIKPFAGFVSTLAHEISALAFEVADLAETTWGAFSRLVAHTIPAMIDDALTDVEGVVGRLSARVTTLARTLEEDIAQLAGRVRTLEQEVSSISLSDVRAYVDQSIDRLNRDLLSEIAAVSAGIYAGIDALRRDLQGQFDILGANVNARIDMLRDLLNPAAIGAIAVAAITAAAPNLFCRNTNAATKRLCGLDAALLDAVLGLSLAFVVLTDPEDIARLALAAEEAMEPVIREIAA